MGLLMLPFVRPIISMALGAVVLVAFFFYLVFNAVNGHILSADFYGNALSEERVYDRLYDEVLVDPELEDTSRELLGNLDVPQHEMAGLARRIMPPAYLQAETERTLDGLIGYLKKDVDELELYVELAGPLDSASRELVAYAENRIDRIEVVDVEQGRQDVSQGDGSDGAGVAGGDGDTEELTRRAVEALEDVDGIRLEQIELETEEEWTDYWERTVRDLEAGQLPSEVPSLAGVSVETRLASYEDALEELRREGDVPTEVLDALEAPDTDRAIREALSNEDPFAGDEIIKEALKAATAGALPPLVEDTLDEVRRELVTPDGTVCANLPEGRDLSRCTRFDVVALAMEDEADIESIDEARDYIRLFTLVGQWGPLVVLVGACLLIVFVNFPRLASMLRWVGIALFIAGLLAFLAGMLAGGTLSSRVDSAVQDALADSDAPPSLTPIVSDVTTNMADVVASSVTSPSLILLMAGLALIAGSLLVRRTPVVNKVPFLSGMVG